MCSITITKESQRLLAISLHAPPFCTTTAILNYNITHMRMGKHLCNLQCHLQCQLQCNTWLLAHSKASCPNIRAPVSGWHLLQHKLLHVCCNSPLAESGDFVPLAELCDISLAAPGDGSFMAADHVPARKVPCPCPCRKRGKCTKIFQHWFGYITP